MQGDCRAQNMPVYAYSSNKLYWIKTDNRGLLDKSEVVTRTGQRKKHFLNVEMDFILA